MCKNTYHHYPGCGHIANWTVDSCTGFTNSLRVQPAGQMLSCEKMETTHDLLPLICPTMCFQCEREWQAEIKKKGCLRDNPNFGKTNVSIEGLGSSAPVVQVTVKSSLGATTDQGDNQHASKTPDAKEGSHPSNVPENKEGLKLPRPPLPPPRLPHNPRPQSQPKVHRKRPVPIVTNATAHKAQAQPTTTSTRTPNTARPIKQPQTASSACIPLPSGPRSPNGTHTYRTYNWIPVPAAPGPPSSSFIYSPESTYSTDVDIPPPSHDSVAASPLLSFLPRPEEYRPLSGTPGYHNRDGVVADLSLPAESFRNGLCIALPRLGGGY